MKFEQSAPEFNPVTITLESEKEVMLLAVAISKTIGGGVDGNFVYNLYCRLADVADYAGIYNAETNPSGTGLTIVTL